MNRTLTGFGLGLRPQHYSALLDGADDGVDHDIMAAEHLASVGLGHRRQPGRGLGGHAPRLAQTIDGNDKSGLARQPGDHVAVAAVVAGAAQHRERTGLGMAGAQRLEGGPPCPLHQLRARDAELLDTVDAPTDCGARLPERLAHRTVGVHTTGELLDEVLGLRVHAPGSDGERLCIGTHRLGREVGAPQPPAMAAVGQE